MSLWEFTAGNTSIVKVADTATLATPELITPVAGGQSFFVAVASAGNNDFNWFALGSGSGGSTGNYTLNSSLLPTSATTTLSDNSIQNGTPETVSVGQAVQGNIGIDGNLVVGPTDVDMYKFVATATGPLNIRTITNQEGSADTVLRAFDASGNPLAANDNIDATTTASSVTINVTAGSTYYVGVSGAGASSTAYDPKTGAGAGAGSTGNYTLAIGAASSSNTGSSRTFDAHTPLKYTGSGGQVVELRLSGPGTGTAVFDSGSADPASVTLDGVTAASTLTVKASSATLGTLTVNGSIKAIVAPTTTFTGAVTISGTDAKLQLGNVSGGAISIATGGPATRITLGAVTDETLTTPGTIASLSVASWATATGTSSITAGAIGKLTAKGDFSASINAASLGPVKVAGSLTGGTWAIAGGGASLAAGDAASAWSATFAAALGAVKLAGDAGSLTAGSIKSLKVTGNVTNATIRLTGASGRVLGSFTAGGDVSGASIRAAGSIGKVDVSSFIGSTLFAGVNDGVTALPSAATDLTSDQTIVSFTARNGVNIVLQFRRRGRLDRNGQPGQRERLQQRDAVRCRHDFAGGV